ncbi:MAG: 50S ribosomal protein L18 [Firmicutes bacterium ADurb.Bin262]|nr:MAG: 50S ribosomal protein L18 [Firmicutes bacterium ADurb.Bin262]
MVNKPDSKKARIKRHQRVRNKISGTAECPRLNVFRSLQNIYAQIIDDERGVTLVSASSVEKGFEEYGGPQGRRDPGKTRRRERHHRRCF